MIAQISRGEVDSKLVGTDRGSRVVETELGHLDQLRESMNLQPVF